MIDLSNKTAVVTGGAGTNIGGSVSKRLAAAGADVAILDVAADRGSETAAAIRAKGGNATAFKCDVTDIETVSAVVDEVAAEFGEIDVLVNNAGGASGVDLEDIDEETFDENVETNLKSAFFVTKTVLPHLRDAESASVVFVSSINALLGGFSEVAYASSKAGLHSLAQCLTADYGPDGIRFNVVCPGSVIGESETWERRELEDPGTKDRIHDLYPAGRYGTPEDVANAITFLVSDRAAWISGVVLPVDGGLSATGGLPGGEWWTEI